MRVLTLLALLLSTVAVSLGQAPPIGMKGKVILVLLKQQRLYAVEDGVILYDFHCCTGRKGRETPTGKTVVQLKKRHNWALPELGGGPIPFTLRIYMYDPKMGRVRRINIHASNDVKLKPDSSGCVRLATVSAKKLFGWAEEKTTTVIVMDGPPPKK